MWANDGFRLHVREAFMEGFDNEIEFCVSQIIPERRVSEDIVNAIVGKPQPRGRPCRECGCSLYGNIALECLG